jgi:hypothetical protein
VLTASDNRLIVQTNIVLNSAPVRLHQKLARIATTLIVLLSSIIVLGSILMGRVAAGDGARTNRPHWAQRARMYFH